HAEKFFRKSLKPSICSMGNWYFTSAASRTLSKQQSQTCRARSSISKGRCLALIRGGPYFSKYNGGPPKTVTKNAADFFADSSISTGKRCRISDCSSSL